MICRASAWRQRVTTHGKRKPDSNLSLKTKETLNVFFNVAFWDVNGYNEGERFILYVAGQSPLA